MMKESSSTEQFGAFDREQILVAGDTVTLMREKMTTEG